MFNEVPAIKFTKEFETFEFGNQLPPGRGTYFAINDIPTDDPPALQQELRPVLNHLFCGKGIFRRHKSFRSCPASQAGIKLTTLHVFYDYLGRNPAVNDFP